MLLLGWGDVHGGKAELRGRKCTNSLDECTQSIFTSDSIEIDPPPFFNMLPV
jgi:hypothetical protein